MSPPSLVSNRTKIPPTALLFVAFQIGVATAAPASKEGRVVDPEKPDRSVLVKQTEAESAEYLEAFLPELTKAESKAETGEMKQEQYTQFVESIIQKTEAAVQATPQSPAVLLSASRVMSQAGRYDQAISLADKAAALAPNDPWPVVNKGVAQFEQCDFPAANRTAREALRRDPGNQNAVALWNLSQRPAGCSNVADKLESRFLGGKMRELAMPGRSASLDFLKGQAGGAVEGGPARGAVSAAGAPTERYTRESFMAFQAMMNAAGQALAAGNNEKAYDVATAAILAAPRNENPGALFLRSIAGLNLKRTDGVIADSTWGAKLDPKNKTKWLAMRAAAENAIGRYAASMSDAREAVALDPNNPGAWSALGRAMQALNHPPEEWLAAYNRASELNAKFTPAYEEALAAANQARGAPKRSKGTSFGGLALPTDFNMLMLVGAGVGVVIGGVVAAFLRREKRADSA